MIDGAIPYEYIEQAKAINQGDYRSGVFISFEFRNMAEIFARKFGGVVLEACTDGTDGCSPNRFKYQVWPKWVEGRFIVVETIDQN